MTSNGDKRTITLGGLIGRRVLSADGREVGRVLDVRAGGSHRTPAGGPALAAEALVIGPHRIGGRLGYDRTEFQGPWVLRTLMRMLHRRSRLVPWSAVEAFGGAGPLRLDLDAS